MPGFSEMKVAGIALDPTNNAPMGNTQIRLLK